MIRTLRYFPFLLLLSLPLQAQNITLTSSNLPILVVTTDAEIPDEPKMTAQLGVVWNSDGSRNYLSEGFNHYDGFIGIERRGSSSQWFEKIGYGFETRLPDGNNNNVPLLGLPAENDWVLHGPYSDKSLLRNALAYGTARAVMDYAPRMKFCELVINGDYKGVYLLLEKIKRDNNRVDIATLNPDDTAGDQLTGGYILKFDKTTGAATDGFVSAYPPVGAVFQETYIQFHSPKPGTIQPAQAAYIQNHLEEFEDVLQSDNWLHPTEGYRAYLNTASLIDHMWLQELSRNVDGYRLSTYFYKDRDSLGGKIALGPVWDFNLGFGNADYCEGSQIEGWAWNFNQVCPLDGTLIHFWWDRLREDPGFRTEAAERWRQLRLSTLSDAALLSRIDSLELLLGEAALRNFIQYPILDEYVWPNPAVLGSWPAEVQRLRNWTLDRAAWIDGVMDDFEGISSTRRPLVSDRFQVQPNPGNGRIRFTVTGLPNGAPVDLWIYDMLGRVVHSDRTTLSGLLWDAHAMPAGTYFYRIDLEGTHYGGRVIVQP